MTGTRPWLLLLLALGGLAAATAGAAGSPSAATLELYRAKCQSCHMADGSSPLEPLNLVDSRWQHGSKPEEVARVIAEGVPGSAMLPFKDQLSQEQITALAAYVRSFDKTLKATKKKR